MPVQALIALVDRSLATRRISNDGRGFECNILGNDQCSITQSLPGGVYGELGHPIKLIGVFLLKMLQRREIVNLRGNAGVELSDRHDSK
jgi:hypothetical protein